LLKLKIPFAAFSAMVVPATFAMRWRTSAPCGQKAHDIGGGYERNNFEKAKACRGGRVAQSANGDPSLPPPHHHARWQSPADAAADTPDKKIDLAAGSSPKSAARLSVGTTDSLIPDF